MEGGFAIRKTPLLNSGVPVPIRQPQRVRKVLPRRIDFNRKLHDGIPSAGGASISRFVRGLARIILKTPLLGLSDVICRRMALNVVCTGSNA